MRDLDLIRQLVREHQAGSRPPSLTAADDVGPDSLVGDPWRDEAAYEAELVALEEVGRWIAARRDALGRLRPTLEECHRLLASKRGSRLAEDIAEEIDLSALYEEALEQPISLEDTRQELQRHTVAVSTPSTSR